jgi:hypothetical protein
MKPLSQSKEGLHSIKSHKVPISFINVDLSKSYERVSCLRLLLHTQI